MDLKSIGPYRILRKIGEGGMGAVYEGVDDRIKRQAAIKLLNPEHATNAQTVARLYSEAMAVNIIKHPSVVQIYDLGQLDDGTTYLVMEYLDGETLSERLKKRQSTMSEEEGIAFAVQLASVLDVAHGHGIVHRDLKPGNIMLVPDEAMPDGERVKLLDFGIAKLQEGQGQKNKSPTQTGMILGSPRYMAPEQCRAEKNIDGKADVYALGILMYQLFAGRTPFVEVAFVELASKHLFEPPPPLAAAAPQLSPSTVQLVHHMLEKEPERRPTMHDVLLSLKRMRQSFRVSFPGLAAIGSGPVAAPPVAAPPVAAPPVAAPSVPIPDDPEDRPTSKHVRISMVPPPADLLSRPTKPIRMLEISPPLATAPQISSRPAPTPQISPPPAPDFAEAITTRPQSSVDASQRRAWMMIGGALLALTTVLIILAVAWVSHEPDNPLPTTAPPPVVNVPPSAVPNVVPPKPPAPVATAPETPPAAPQKVTPPAPQKTTPPAPSQLSKAECVALKDRGIGLKNAGKYKDSLAVLSGFKDGSCVDAWVSVEMGRDHHYLKNLPQAIDLYQDFLRSPDAKKPELIEKTKTLLKSACGEYGNQEWPRAGNPVEGTELEKILENMKTASEVCADNRFLALWGRRLHRAARYQEAIGKYEQFLATAANSPLKQDVQTLRASAANALKQPKPPANPALPSITRNPFSP